MEKVTLLLTVLFAQGIVMGSYVDSNGYCYKDESTVRDKRNIAILSYGSLVRQPVNLQNGVQLRSGPFEATTNLYLPVSLTRKSQGGPRFTAVIDPLSVDLKMVWAAESNFAYLPNARNNLAGREGAPYRGQGNAYDLTNIFYIKKILPGRPGPRSNEMIVSGTTNWIIRKESNSSRQLASGTAKAIALWADSNNFNSVIWASFSQNITQANAIRDLLADDILLVNTQAYVRNLADGPQSDFERAIVSGKDALRSIRLNAY